jgi:hypothetical protein
MKKLLVLFCVCILVFGMALAACGQKKAASSSEAIDTAKAMDSVEKQADYLVKQAELFYESKEYKDAVASAQYVLNNLDKESAKAQELVEKAKAELGGAVTNLLKGVKK